MYLDNEIDELLDLLCNAKSLGQIKFIKACPFAKKPTRLDKKIGTVSVGELDLESISVGDENFYGKYAVDINLYVPFDFGSPVAYDDMESIVRVLMSEAVCAIKLSSVVKDTTTECYRLKATFTYSLAYSKEA